MVYEQFWCRTSVAHIDSPCVVDGGLTTLLSSLADQNREALLDVGLLLFFPFVSNIDVIS